MKVRFSLRLVLLSLSMAGLLACSPSLVNPADSTSSTSDSTGGSAVLTWTAPTTNTDLTALIDLSGYQVSYGTSSGVYTQTVDVGNVTSYTVTGLGSGTYYFSVRAYDDDGNYSPYATEGSKTIE